MYNRLEQDSFSSEPFTSSKMNLHTRPGRFSDRVLLFIHGLGGGGYKTWHEFPSIIFDEHLTDVAIYDYVSFRRRLRGGGAEIDVYIDMLAAQVEELETNYQSIYLIGHSLGGVMAEAATMKYLTFRTSERPTPLTPVCALILFASPRAGAALALPVVRNLFKEGKWLSRRSLQNQRTDEFFSTKIQGDASLEVDKSKIFIPRYVCRGIGDRIVDAFSALNSIPAGQRLSLSHNHRSIVKPTTMDAEQIKWVNKSIAYVEACRQKFRERQLADKRTNETIAPAPSVVVTELWTRGSDGAKWAQVYNEVRASVSSPDPEVHDHRDVLNADVDLLISLAGSDFVLDGGATDDAEMVDAVLARKRSSSNLTIGLSAVGSKSTEATHIIERWLHRKSWPPDIFVNGADDDEALRLVMSRWIYNIIRRNPRTAKLQGLPTEQLLKIDFGPTHI